MSTMTLELPMNYVEVERDEMEYVDGGFYYMTNADVVGFVSTFISVGGGVTLASVGLLTADITGATALIAASIPGIGWAAAGLIAANAAQFAYACINAIMEGKGVDISFGFPTGLRFSVK